MSGLLAFMQANDAEANDAEANDAATEFLQSRTDLWTTWVSAVADAPGAASTRSSTPSATALAGP